MLGVSANLTKRAVDGMQMILTMTAPDIVVVSLRVGFSQSDVFLLLLELTGEHD